MSVLGVRIRGDMEDLTPSLPSFDGLIVDLDGVVWVGPSAVPGSVAALGELRARGVRLLFMTNDPRGSRADYAAQLRHLGIEVDESDIVTSASALGSLLAGAAGRTAYVIGSPALKAELAGAGLRLLEGDAARDADVVAVGGHAGFDYGELRIAGQAVRRGALLYATGRDVVMPDGPWPGTGAILAAVEAAAGKKATVVGKPEPFIFDHARSLLADCKRLAIVGDDLDSDIAGGKRAGLATILVLSGTATQADLVTARVLGGDDVIYGLGGNDRICGDVNGLREGGDDVIYAGSGDDRVMGDAADIRRAGDDTVYGGEGNEVFLLGDGDRVRIGGDDWVSGGDGNDDSVEGDGAEIGTGGNDWVFGDAGNDTGVAGDGLEAIDTGGHDHIFGGDGDDSLDGDQTIGDSPDGGDDELDGGAGFDSLDGDTGFDRCVNGEAVVNCEAP